MLIGVSARSRGFWGLLSKQQRLRYIALQIIMLVASIFELVAVASIAPLVSVLVSGGSAPNGSYELLYDYLALVVNESDTIYVFAIFFVLLVLVSNILMFITQYFMTRFSFGLGADTSNKLFNEYIQKDVVDLEELNSSQIVQMVMRNSERFSRVYVASSLTLLSRLYSVTLLAMLVFMVDPLVATINVVVLSLIYFLIATYLRRRVFQNGRIVALANERRNKLIVESKFGAKEIKIYSAAESAKQHYRDNTELATHASSENLILGQVPYYVVETFMLTATIVVVLYLNAKSGDMGAVIPMLSIYAFAGIKMLPKFQQIYQAYTKMKGAEHCLNEIIGHSNSSDNREELSSFCEVVFKEKLQLVDLVIDRYGRLRSKLVNGNDESLPKINVSIESRTFVGIYGESGIGKTTMVEVILGLLEPSGGVIKVDGRAVNLFGNQSWFDQVSYASQAIFTTHDTVYRNIAFGCQHEQVDMDRVVMAATIACIHEDIKELEKGYEAELGENAVTLSGGQLQRLGLARAVYKKSRLIVLDEITSSQDPEMQRRIMKNLKMLSTERTVILITHSHENLEYFDVAYDATSRGLSII